MSSMVAALLLVGFFAALTAFWFWSRAGESAVDADLQERLWDHSKDQREFETATPRQVADWLRGERRKYLWLTGLLALIALGCFGYTFLLLNQW